MERKTLRKKPAGRRPPIVVSRRLELVRLLEGFEPSPDERAALGQMRALASSPHDILSAYWFDPGHFTASAFVTDREMRQTVLVNHRRLKAWVQPGGHIDPGDLGIRQAATREVVEETGLEVVEVGSRLFDVDVHRVPAHGGAPAHLHLDLRFHVVVAAGPPAPGAEEAEAAWVFLAEVDDWTDDRAVRRGAAKLRAMAASPGDGLSDGRP